MKYKYIQKRQKNSTFKSNKSNYRKNRKLVAARYFGRRIKRDLTNFFKWIFLAIITGLIVGGASSVFAGCIREATAFRNSHLWIFMLLPVSGVLIVFMYRKMGRDDRGTNQVLSTIKSKDDVPLRSAPYYIHPVMSE